jgi:CRISPR system Cascade subunit CasA
MTPSYNLIEVPWLPCVKPDGSIEHLGILEALARAAELRELRDPSPLVTIALHRLLLAVLHRVFGPESPDDWSRLWNEGIGQFDRERLEGYLRRPDIHPRFDLFHEKYPFYQTGSLPLGPVVSKTGRPKFVKPIWQMAHELAYSDSMNLFAHFKEGDWETRSCDEAARWLVAFQGFALGGLITTEEGRKAQDGSADAGQLVKSAVVLAKGDNLFQTLMFNLIHYSAEDGMPFAFKSKLDKPAWERSDETKPEDRRYDGYLDLLTWQSRRVKLVPDLASDVMLQGVTGVVTMKGFQLPDQYWRKDYEAMVGYLKAKDATGKQDPWPPLGFRSGKDLWRDSHALFQSVGDECERPRVLSWIDDCRQRGYLSRKAVNLEVAGMSADRAKIFFWRHETLPLPLAYLDDNGLVEVLKMALALAEACAKEALRPAVWAAAADRLTGSTDMQPDKKRVGDLVDSFAPDRVYWSRLELPFRELLAKFPEGDSDHRSACLNGWYWNTLHLTALEAFEATIGQMDAGRDLKAVSAGRSRLYTRLEAIQKDHHIPDRDKAGAA